MWEDNVKMGFPEMVLDYVDWIQLAQDRDWWQAVVNAVVNVQIP
jgi:hypothetical protein